MKLSEKRLDKFAMRLWASLNGVRRNLEGRWRFISDQPETDKYRQAVRDMLAQS